MVQALAAFMELQAQLSPLQPQHGTEWAGPRKMETALPTWRNLLHILRFFPSSQETVESNAEISNEWSTH